MHPKATFISLLMIILLQWPLAVAADEGAQRVACSPTWSANLTVTDSAAASRAITFGLAPGATASYDAGCDVLAPPLPPGGAFDARFKTSTDDSFTDYQNTGGVSNTWTVSFASSSYPVTVSWETSSLPSGTFLIRDLFGGIIVPDTDMKANSSVQVTNSALTQLQISYLAPTGVSLDTFVGSVSDGNVLLGWATSAEWDHAGFNVYRTADATFSRNALVNPLFIGARGSQGQGASYELQDSSVQSGQWYYWLEDVDIFGVRTVHAPVRVEVGVPTAVTLSQSGVQVSGSEIWWQVALFGALLCLTLITVASNTLVKPPKFPN